MSNVYFSTGKAVKHSRLLSLIRAGKMVMPIAADIHTSTRCNLRCNWCIGENTYIGPAQPDILNESNIRTVIDRMIEHEQPRFPNYPKLIHFAGYRGEPLLSRATVVGMRHLTEKGKQVGLVTNGTLLGGEEVLDAAASISSLQVSLDAPDRKIFEAVKGRDLFPRVISNLARVADRKEQLGSEMHLSVGYVLSYGNSTGLQRLVRTLSDLGVQQMRFRVDFFAQNDSAFVKSMQRQVEALKAEGRMEIVDKFSSFPVGLVSSEDCYSQQLWPTIGSDGGVYPCAHSVMPGFVIGSLFKNTLEEIWRLNFPRLRKPAGRCEQLCPTTHGNINAFKDSGIGQAA